jgi:hypothetical protein
MPPPSQQQEDVESPLLAPPEASLLQHAWAEFV